MALISHRRNTQKDAEKETRKEKKLTNWPMMCAENRVEVDFIEH